MDKQINTRKKIVMEIVDTEEKFVEKLTSVVNVCTFIFFLVPGKYLQHLFLITASNLSSESHFDRKRDRGSIP